MFRLGPWSLPRMGQGSGLCQFGVRVVGTIQLVTLVRDYAGIYVPTEADAEGQLKFDEAAHTYDLDNGTYLGHGDRLPLRLGRYTFRAFARLPYRVLTVLVVARGSTKGDTLQLGPLDLTSARGSREVICCDSMCFRLTGIRYVIWRRSASRSAERRRSRCRLH